MVEENYWKKMYGEQSKDFIKGVIVGVRTFAIWRDGVQYVGVGTPLKVVVKEIKDGLGWKDEWEENKNG